MLQPSTAPAVAAVSQCLPEPGLTPQWITRDAYYLPGQTAGQNEPRNAGFDKLRRVSRRAAAEQSRRRPTAAARAPKHSCPLDLRSTRLIRSRVPLRLEPTDRDPTAEIQPYPFGLSLLLKSPRLSVKSIRSPLMFKNIYGLAQFLAVNPLSFLEFEPAVQFCCFCKLDPRVLV